ncbi:MAG: hypothetical protein LBT04_08730 [Prevotellaceae bacterium]|jgi:hypothetical protein|nr:hypothetical protein [Prevotellaceae bacterium]
MLHARKDYDRIQDPDNKIPADEPVFLLRGQDKFAPELLLRWASKLRLDGGDTYMARLVEDWAQVMLEWQDTHCIKTPDLDYSKL